MDLFEYLWLEIGCTYVSDMHSGEANHLAKQLIKEIAFEKYTPAQLTDAAKYLYGGEKVFNSIEEAKAFLQIIADKHSHIY